MRIRLVWVFASGAILILCAAFALHLMRLRSEISDVHRLPSAAQFIPTVPTKKGSSGAPSPVDGHVARAHPSSAMAAVTPATTARNTIRNSLGGAPRSDALTAAPEEGRSDMPIRQRISLKFDRMVWDDPTNVFPSADVASHAALQLESDDPNWSAAAEEELGARIRDAFGDRIDQVSIECRTNLCELRLASREGNDYTADMREVGEFFGQAGQKDWYRRREFDQRLFGLNTLGNGLPIYLIFISRR